MPKTRLILFFFLFVRWTYSQDVETIINSDFTIRDFVKQNDSIIFIKKRNVYLYDFNSKTSSNYFIGGYGLELSALPTSGMIISASNELVNNVSSVRFYNIENQQIKDLFYYRNGKIIDFLIIPEIHSFVLSLSNNKIILIDYEGKPRFLKAIEIELASKSRKVLYFNNELFYITDSGEIYKYSLKDYSKKLLHKTESVLTDFFLTEDILIYSTIDGQIIKMNRKNGLETELIIEKNFILNSVKNDKRKTLICGSWNGTIYEINLENFSIKNEYKHHSRSVLKVKVENDSILYSCGLDKTIKKWKLK